MFCKNISSGLVFYTLIAHLVTRKSEYAPGSFPLIDTEGPRFCIIFVALYQHWFFLGVQRNIESIKEINDLSQLLPSSSNNALFTGADRSLRRKEK